MRGDHRHLGRQDYTEPAPLSEQSVSAVGAVVVAPVEGRKTWHSAHSRDSTLLGYVTTRLAGQMYRLPSDEGWRWCASDWNRGDPPHAHAVLALLRVTESHTTLTT